MKNLSKEFDIKTCCEASSSGYSFQRKMDGDGDVVSLLIFHYGLLQVKQWSPLPMLAKVNIETTLYIPTK